MKKQLDLFWHKQFGDFAPIAHNIKHVFTDKWVRFHALPESKRYPESEAEYKEVLRRHRAVLSEVLNGENEMLVIVTEYSENNLPKAPNKEIRELLPNTEYWSTSNQLDEYGCYWHQHTSKIALDSDSLNAVLRLVADDAIRNLMFVLLDQGAVYHPYDGGADVVLETSVKRDDLKAKFSGWLSNHPKGY